MKKLVALAIILSLAMAGQCYAASSEAINPEAQPVTIYGVSGTGVEKMSSGAHYITRITGSGQIYTGVCQVYSVNIYSDTLGDMISIYNGVNGGAPPTGLSLLLLEFEIGIAANTSSNSYDAKGVTFNNGIYVLASDGTNSVVTVTYDY